MNSFGTSKLFSSLIALVMITAVAIVPLAGAIIHAQAQSTVSFSEFPIPTSVSQPTGITAGPDGNLWFTETGGNKIGVINTTGSIIAEYPVPTSHGDPFGITTGPDGNLWFTEFLGNKIGVITTTGSIIAEYPIPPANSGEPLGITTGPDGNLWFTENLGNNIGVITPNGTITEYPIPTSSSAPIDIITGPDGNLWFTEDLGKKIGRITPSGTITEYPLPNNHQPYGITAGPDGNLWFAEISASSIGRITPSGTITEYPIPSGTGDPTYITTGSDGNLWFTEDGGNRIDEITPNGAITEYPPVPTSMSQPLGITKGPDGNLWFVENTGNNIGRAILSSTSLPVTVQKVWTADSNNNAKTSFAPGDTINYETQVNNPNSTAVTASFTFLASGPQQIFSWSGSQSIAAGTSTITQASTVPSTAPAGTYTLTVTVTYNGVSSQGQSSFIVVPIRANYTYNYSGYDVEGTTYSDVRGSWIQPSAVCTGIKISKAAIWVGLGGVIQTSTLEQVGTTVDCIGGKPQYRAWYEMFPADPIYLVQKNPKYVVMPNDSIHTRVSYKGNGSFFLEIGDSTRGWDFSTTALGPTSDAARGTADWIVEDPSFPECRTQAACPLTHFVTSNQPIIQFSNCSVDGKSLSIGPVIDRLVISSDSTPGGKLKAFPLKLTNDSTAFNVQWNNP